MATDPRLAAPRPASYPDHASDLVAQVHRHSRAVIEAELRRLTRKVSSLGPADLDVIAAMLEELSESLFIARLRSAPQATAPLLWRLFDAPRQDS